ncbi:MAG: hypothetical protein IT458_13965 [Planctomycetes bacterium]|nr:hypothetical protein [Planctomycetota bacterium]
MVKNNCQAVRMRIPLANNCVLSLWCSTIVLVACGLAGAQNRAATATFTSYRSGTEGGYLHTKANSSSTLYWTVSEGPAQGAETTLDLPFDLVGEALEIAPKRFLVSGYNATRATAYLLELCLTDTPRKISVERAAQYGNRMDPYRLHWNASEGLLYVYDVRESRIVVAPYRGRELPSVQAFLVVANVQSVPELSDKYRIVLASAPNDVSGVCISLLDEVKFTHLKTVGPGAWLSVPGSRLGNPIPMWNTDAPAIASPNALGPIRVNNVAGRAYLCDVTMGAGVLAQVTVTDPNTFVQLPLPEGGLIPGLRYEIRGEPNAQVAPLRFMGLLRYGLPQVTSKIEMPFGYIHPAGFWIGNSEFGVVGWLRSGAVSQGPVPVNLYLWIGARRPDGTDPVTTVGGVTVLSEVVGSLGPMPVTVADKLTHGPVQVSLPVPYDEGLVGAVLLWQWAAVDAVQSVTVSDVFGAMVTSPWVEPESATRSGSRDSARVAFSVARSVWPKVSAEVVNKAKTWVKSIPGGGVDASESLIRERVLRGR